MDRYCGDQEKDDVQTLPEPDDIGHVHVGLIDAKAKKTDIILVVMPLSDINHAKMINSRLIRKAFSRTFLILSGVSIEMLPC